MSSATTRATRSRRTTKLLTSGVFTVPAGVYELDVLCVGGGGAGGSCDTQAGNASGGGGGGWPLRARLAVTPGESLAALVGAGGSPTNPVQAQAIPTGGDGGLTSFAGQVFAPGGAGGGNSNSSVGNAGGSSLASSGGGGTGVKGGGGGGYSGGGSGGAANNSNNSNSPEGRGGVRGLAGARISSGGQGGGGVLNPNGNAANYNAVASSGQINFPAQVDPSHYGCGGGGGDSNRAPSSDTTSVARNPTTTGRAGTANTGNGGSGVATQSGDPLLSGGIGGSGVIVLTWEE